MKVKSVMPVDDVERLREELSAWRSRQTSPKPYPKELMDRAVALAGRFSVSRVATALRLNYRTLRNWLEAQSPKPPIEPTAFIEFFPATADGLSIPRCSLEIETPSGAELRLKLSQTSPSVVGALLRELLS